jgi:NitT/TauT family transport system permease protein
MNERALRVLAPAGVLALSLLVWDLVVRINGIPPYILPGPGLVLSTLVSDWGILWSSLLATLETTVEGLALAVAGGVGLAILFNQSRLIEHSLYPYAVILQVTPVVAIAPLLLIYLPQQAAVLACAWIVAFFPVLANTTLGLADRRGGGGNRRGLGRSRLRPGLSHRRIRLPAQYPAHVRGAAAAVARRHRDLRAAVGADASRAAPLARERGHARVVENGPKLRS